MLMTLTLIGGCAGGFGSRDTPSAPVIVDYVKIWCATESPIRPTEAQFKILSRKDKEAIVSHNEYGEAKCGWKP